eukprot:gene27440-4741_t
MLATCIQEEKAEKAKMILELVECSCLLDVTILQLLETHLYRSAPCIADSNQRAGRPWRRDELVNDDAETSKAGRWTSASGRSWAKQLHAFLFIDFRTLQMLSFIQELINHDADTNELINHDAENSAAGRQLSWAMLLSSLLSIGTLILDAALRAGKPWIIGTLGVAWALPLLAAVKLLVERTPRLGTVGTTLQNISRSNLALIQPQNVTAAVYSILGFLVTVAGGLLYLNAAAGADLSMLAAPMGAVGAFAARLIGAGMVATGKHG